ncbi:MAG: hypothetical protein KBC64_07865 [Simkaniaceae bacterium]|nr:hypothetical protein [Simkaniaceae bacterium]
MKQLTSLEDFDAESRRTSNSKGVAIDNKLNDFLNINVKQPREFKPSSTTNISAPMFKPPAVSVREISFTPQYPQYPPLYRHATVRFN